MTNTLRHIPYIGTGRFCPVCGKQSKKFAACGVVVPRDDAMCTYCGALERHRFIWLFFKKMTNLFGRNPKKMLHIAPEPAFEAPLRKHLHNGYLTADLNNPNAMVKMDITDIRYPNGTFDVIYCSHVLEHVPNDRLAIREFYRVLKPDGWAVIMVPISCQNRTIEDLSVSDPVKRLKLFGQKDHLRIYGHDFLDRLVEAGFNVRVFIPSDFLQEKEIFIMAISKEAGEIYYCTK
jgi:SAM-dependent methyltransferase